MRHRKVLALLAALFMAMGSPSLAWAAPVVRVVNDGQGHGLVVDGGGLFDEGSFLPGDGASGSIAIENEGAETLRVTLSMSGLGSDGRLDDLLLTVTQGQRIIYEGSAGSCDGTGIVDVGALLPGDGCSIDVGLSVDPAFGNDRAMAEGGAELVIGADPVPVAAGETAGSIPKTEDYPVLWPAAVSAVAGTTALLLHAQRRRS